VEQWQAAAANGLDRGGTGDLIVAEGGAADT
jgi:hypothetical protein